MKCATRKKRSLLWLMPKEDFSALVRSCSTYREILRRLRTCDRGDNFRRLKLRIQADRIDDSHIRLNPPWFAAHKVTRTPLDAVLVKDGKCHSNSRLRLRLIKAGLLKDACSVCGLQPVWNGQPLVMALDHINGNSSDYRLENLRSICPNCHSQTNNFAGRNAKWRK